MKKVYLLLLLMYSSFVFSQDFDTAVEQVSNALSDVQTAKKEFKQSIEVVKPGVVRIHLEEIPVKGDTKIKEFVFSPYDIDKHTIRAIAKGDKISVQLLASKNQKMIRQTIDNEKVSYINKFYVLANDIKNGRELANQLKALIPITKKIIDNRLSLTTYDDYKTWLQDNIGNVELSKKQIEQTFEVKDDYYGSITFKKEISDGKKTIHNTFNLNVLTIEPRLIGFKVEGGIFNVVLKAKKSLINHLIDEKHKNFVKDFKVAFSDIEKARDFKKVMKDFIPISKEKFKQSIPTISGLQQGYELLNQNNASMENGKYSVTQNFEGKCVVNFEQTLNDGKKDLVTQYKFNLVDINSNKLELNNEKGFYTIKLITLNNKKFIKNFKNNELQSYRNNLMIYVPDIEKALINKVVLKKMIEICKKQNEEKQIASDSKTLKDFIKDNIKNVEIGNYQFEQKFEFGDENSATFKQTKISKSKSDEYLYEFYLNDINPKTVTFKTSGKSVYVEAKTNNMEKSIKFYKNGKIGKYQNNLKIEASDIENARNISRYLKKLFKISQTK